MKRKEIPVCVRHEGHQLDWFDLVQLVESYRKKLLIGGEVREIRPSFVDVPGYLYTEHGVAGPSHPTAGSIGVYVRGKDDLEAGFQLIYYYDYNITGSHCDGLLHWNLEYRLIDSSGKETPVRGDEVRGAKHVLPDTSYLDIYCLGPDGLPRTLRINRDDFRPVRSP